MFRVVQWCRILSRTAAAITLSPKISPHSPYDLFEVNIVDDFSYLREIRLKKQWAPSLLKGRYPISSTIRRWNLVSPLIRSSSLFSYLALIRRSIRCEAFAKYTLNPCRTASYPNARARWVFPTPGGPRKTTFSVLWMNRNEARSRITAGSREGRKLMSKRISKNTDSTLS